jgi:hypothetical protein
VARCETQIEPAFQGQTGTREGPELIHRASQHCVSIVGRTGCVRAQSIPRSQPGQTREVPMPRPGRWRNGRRFGVARTGRRPDLGHEKHRPVACSSLSEAQDRGGADLPATYRQSRRPGGSLPPHGASADSVACHWRGGGAAPSRAKRSQRRA